MKEFTLIECIEAYSVEMIEIGKHRPSTTRHYQILKRKMSAYLMKKDIPLIEFNRENARNFNQWLKGDMSDKSVYHYCLLTKAVLQYFIDEYPNDEYPGVPAVNVMNQITKQPVTRSSPKDNYVDLNIEQDLWNLKLPDKLKAAQTLCLWQWNTGMSFIDLGNNPTFDIKKANDNDNVEVITYRRVKTDNHSEPIECIVPIYEFTQRLIDSLNWVSNNGTLRYFFPIPCWITEVDGMLKVDYTKHKANYEWYRRSLIKISKLVPISTKSHAYRHTFGVKMSQKGHSMDAIRQMMGHKSVKMTEKVYVPITAEKITSEQKRILS